MKAEEVKAIASEVGSKKARKIKFDKTPEGTKEKKVRKEVLKGLEDHFGSNLAKLRVHLGGNSAELCRELKAKAFSNGRDIYFLKDSFAKDEATLAHELVHVLNATKGKVLKPKDGVFFKTKK